MPRLKYHLSRFTIFFLQKSWIASFIRVKLFQQFWCPCFLILVAPKASSFSAFWVVRFQAEGGWGTRSPWEAGTHLGSGAHNQALGPSPVMPSPSPHKYVEVRGPLHPEPRWGARVLLSVGPANSPCCPVSWWLPGSKEYRLLCHLVALPGTGSNVSYFIGNLTWLLNNPINQTRLILLELMSLGNAAMNNEGFAPPPAPLPAHPSYFFLRATQQLL